MGVKAQILYHDTFDSKGFTNENTLANAMLTKPDVINPVITHLSGKESDKFPLTFMTEGKGGGYKTISVSDIQYEWNTIGRMRNGTKIVSTTYIAGDKPGLNGSPFYFVTEDNWLKRDHTITSPNGVKARVMEGSTPVGSGHYKVTAELISPDDGVYVPLTELVAGVAWAMEGGASVSESFSMGNESNVMAPGKKKNQISILRKSYRWGGNLANKTVEVQFNVDGKLTNYWMPFQEWQYMLQWKQSCEEHYWTSQYNRALDGTIRLKDYNNGLPIPIGGGVDYQIPNRDTYSTLTYRKIEETVGDVMYGATDTGKMDVVLYTGVGGLREFSKAMLAQAGTYTQITGDKFVKGEGRNLYLSGFFTAFEHIDGHIITVKKLNMCDYGAQAEIAPKHPTSGLPITSYDMYFVDQSMYDGSPNVQMVSQKGRSMLRGVVKGMAPLNQTADGSDFNGNNMIATEKDENSIHFLSSKGVCIRRNNHCFKLSCDLS